MSTLAEIERQLGARGTRKPPPRTITLQPAQFCAQWARCPVTAVEFGLRLPSDADVDTARKEALIAAAEHDDPEEQVIAYNSTLMRIAVARGLCHPHDVTLPHPFLELPEDLVPIAFPSNTIKTLFDEIEKLQIEQSPLFLEADAREIKQLAELLQTDDPFADLERVNKKRALRYLRFALELIAPADAAE